MFTLFLHNKKNVRRKTFLFDFFSTRRISSFLQRIFYTHRELPAANAAADLSTNTKAPPARLCFRTSKRPDSSRAANPPAEKTVRRQVFIVGGRPGKTGISDKWRRGAPVHGPRGGLQKTKHDPRREFRKSGSAVRRFPDLGEVTRKRSIRPGASRRGVPSSS